MDVSGQALTTRIGYEFRSPAVLRAALTHRSRGAGNYERLEFLGDSVLSLVIALELFERFPKSSEGELSRLRAALVNKHSLHEIARDLDLGQYLLLGEGELKSGGFRRPSILADALEALLGAILVDGGFEAVREVIKRLFAGRLDQVNPKTIAIDPKTRLQEYLQSKHIALPRYEVIGVSGEAHEQVFRVLCHIPERELRAEGEGPSRRAAEMAAAERIYQLVHGG